jgi:hypothetical protein
MTAKYPSAQVSIQFIAAHLSFGLLILSTTTSLNGCSNPNFSGLQNDPRTPISKVRDEVTFVGEPGIFVQDGCNYIIKIPNHADNEIPFICLDLKDSPSNERALKDAMLKQNRIRASGSLSSVLIQGKFTLRILSPVTSIEPVIPSETTFSQCVDDWRGTAYSKRVAAAKKLAKIRIQGTSFQLSNFVPVILTGLPERPACSILISKEEVKDSFVWNNVPSSQSEFLGNSDARYPDTMEALNRNQFDSAIILNVADPISKRGLYEIFHEGFHWFQAREKWKQAGRQADEDWANKFCYKPFQGELESEFDALLDAIEAAIAGNRSNALLNAERFFAARSKRLTESVTANLDRSSGARGLICREHESNKEQFEGTAEFVSSMAANIYFGRDLSAWLSEERTQFEEKKAGTTLWENSYYRLGMYQLILMNLLDPVNFMIAFSEIAFPADASENPVEAALRKVIQRSR